MSLTTGFTLLSERSWEASLVVELVDPISGLLVHQGIDLRALVVDGGLELAPTVVTPSGRFAFRRLPPGEAMVLRATPLDAPFLPARLVVPGASKPARTRPARIILVPRRGYPFAAKDRVIHRCLRTIEGPVAGAEVAPDPATALLAMPARTDADGEFVLLVRTNGAGWTDGAAPGARAPMPPGLSPGPAPVVAPRRLGLVFTFDGERRYLPAGKGPILRQRGQSGPAGPDFVIYWDQLDRPKP
jgi:hypothetical protein